MCAPVGLHTQLLKSWNHIEPITFVYVPHCFCVLYLLFIKVVTENPASQR